MRHPDQPTEWTLFLCCHFTLPNIPSRESVVLLCSGSNFHSKSRCCEPFLIRNCLICSVDVFITCSTAFPDLHKLSVSCSIMPTLDVMFSVSSRMESNSVSVFASTWSWSPCRLRSWLSTIVRNCRDASFTAFLAVLRCLHWRVYSISVSLSACWAMFLIVFLRSCIPGLLFSGFHNVLSPLVLVTAAFTNKGFANLAQNV